jgi:hypothetical protein
VGAGESAGFPTSVHLVLEVSPDEGMPFRAETRVNLQGLGDKRHFASPQVGETLPVKYDAKHEKVKVVVDAAHDQRVRDAEEKQRWQAMIDAPAGSGAPAQAATVQGGTDLAETLRNAVSQGITDPHALEHLVEQAFGGSAHVVVNDVVVEPGSGTNFGSLFGEQPQADPVDRLKVLADLKEKGMLTDEEFAAQKARILGES